MTWTTLAATSGAGALSGRGAIVLWLRIAGIPYVFSTEDLKPPAGDTWYWDGATELFEDVVPYMKWGGMSIEERASFIDGTLDVQSFPVELADVDEDLTKLIKSWRARAMTRLEVSFLSGENHAHVETTAAWPASGQFWVDLEACNYGNKVGAQFQAVDRGWYGSIETDHLVDTTAFPVRVQPAVLDGPQILANRRADVFASTVDQAGQVSASECIFRGYVGPDIEAGQGVLKLNVEHISRLWSRKVAQQLPQTSILPGYWFSGETAYSMTTIRQKDITDHSIISVDAYLSEGLRASPHALGYFLNDDLETAQTGAGFSRLIYIHQEEENSLYWLCAQVSSDYELALYVSEGSPLWALGFNQGWYDFPIDAANVVHHEAQSKPVAFYCELPRRSPSLPNPEFRVFDATKLVDDEYVVFGGSPAIKIASLTAPHTIVLDGPSMDTSYFESVSSGDLTGRGYNWVAIEDEKDLIIRHCLYFDHLTISEVIERLCGLAGTQPANWVVGGFRSGEISASGGELDDCLAYPVVPEPLATVTDAIVEPISVSEYICDRLGVLGIVPRITTDGNIGFARLKTPDIDSSSTVSLDSAIWELMEAKSVMTQIEGEPILNQLKINHSNDYRTNRWPKVCRLNYDDGRSVMGKTRAKTYDLRGLHVSTSGAHGGYPDETTLIMDVAQYALGGQFGVYGRVSPVVSIPCTWPSRQLWVGDIVSITHPTIVDTTEGVVGVTSRLGIVVGRRLAVTTAQSDALLVQIPPETPVARIAPCAYADAWDAGNKKLTFSDTSIYCQAGADDLDAFKEDYEVLCIEYDATVPTIWGPVTIDSVAAGEIVLDADPFAGAFPANGVWVVYADYDDCFAGQEARWLFFGRPDYTLGAGGDEAKVWAA